MAPAKDREEATSKKDHNEDEDLSEEDLALKQNLELCVKQVQQHDADLQKMALESMRQKIQSATSSMISVPKPLKFLRSHYGELKTYHEIMEDTYSKESLKFRLLGSNSDIGTWGHAYLRNLALEIADEYTKIQKKNGSVKVEDIVNLAEQIAAFHMQHNAEPEAVDLALEVENLDLIFDHVDSANYKRTCLYLTAFARYLDGDINLILARDLYLKFNEYTSVLQIALYLDDVKCVKEIFRNCNDLQYKKQFCYILARQGVPFELDDKMVANDADRKQLQDIANNTKLSEGYLNLARDIEVMEPKSPEDIYKAHLLHSRAGQSVIVDSWRENLATTFVNAFLNAGFGKDKLMTVPSEASENYIFENKPHGITSVIASLGMIFQWDIDSGLAQIDKYCNSRDISDNHVRPGALLGAGIAYCSIKKNHHDAWVRLRNYVDKEEEDPSVRICAIMGLGISYANTQNEEVGNKLTRVLGDPKAPLDVVAFTAISLGLVYVGSCNKEVAEAIISCLMARSESELPLCKFISLGLGLLYLGKKDDAEEEIVEKGVAKLNGRMKQHADATLISCSYAGTGNQQQVQWLLDGHLNKIVTWQPTEPQAVIGIAMIAMSEEVGINMAIRLLEHLLQYGELNIRRAVPLALGLLCISNPKVNVMDTLGRLSHDHDATVAMAAIIALGLIGSGTNNARIAKTLRNLSFNYNNHPRALFCVRIAQGLLHLGKGLLTLNPFHSERFLLSPTALAGLTVVLHACLDMESIILGDYPYVLYFLVLAMQPRMLMTVDENLKPLAVTVRVGKAVDVAGQAGRPKTITGFQTHETPVVLAAGERAELATEKYIPLSPTLEGFVILKENPDYREDS